MVDANWTVVGSAYGYAKDAIEHLKPSRAPYVLAVSAGAIFVEFSLLDDKMSLENQKFVIFPIFVFIFVLAVLAFYFKPFDQHQVDENENSIKLDVDMQFKLARTTGLVVGTSCLFLLSKQRENIDWLFLYIWVLIMAHCSVYLVYIVFRNINEETIANRSFFQISFLTALFLFLITFTGARVREVEGSYLYSSCVLDVLWSGADKGSLVNKAAQRQATIKCADGAAPAQNNIVAENVKSTLGKMYAIPNFDQISIRGISEPRYEISLTGITMIYFNILWLVYILFWVVQLKKIWRTSPIVLSA